MGEDVGTGLGAQPGGTAEVVGMAVRDDDRVDPRHRDRRPAQPVEQPVPGVLAGQARVDDGEAPIVLERVAVDVAESRELDRQLHPHDARRDLGDLLAGRLLLLLRHHATTLRSHPRQPAGRPTRPRHRSLLCPSESARAGALGRTDPPCWRAAARTQLEFGPLSALGGSRTPNLLIRSHGTTDRSKITANRGVSRDQRRCGLLVTAATARFRGIEAVNLTGRRDRRCPVRARNRPGCNRGGIPIPRRTMDGGEDTSIVVVAVGSVKHCPSSGDHGDERRPEILRRRDPRLRRTGRRPREDPDATVRTRPATPCLRVDRRRVPDGDRGGRRESPTGHRAQGRTRRGHSGRTLRRRPHRPCSRTQRASCSAWSPTSWRSKHSFFERWPMPSSASRNRADPRATFAWNRTLRAERSRLSTRKSRKKTSFLLFLAGENRAKTQRFARIRADRVLAGAAPRPRA